MGISATIATSFALITRFVEVAIDTIGLKEIFVKPLQTKPLLNFTIQYREISTKKLQLRYVGPEILSEKKN
ncbi:MAG: hypothetical protein MZV64_26090 [Ignavibacteriales bacterium]|nr:hypothetical protein [Ignavibacteriales bacterium]